MSTFSIQYLNHCDLCNDIRHFLFQVPGRSFRELAPAGFYADTRVRRL